MNMWLALDQPSRPVMENPAYLANTMLIAMAEIIKSHPAQVAKYALAVVCYGVVSSLPVFLTQALEDENSTSG